MIPMVVRYKNVRLGTRRSFRVAPAVSQHPQTRAAIQDELRTIRRNQFQAWRVSAIPPRRGIHRGRGTAHTPEGQFGDGMIHLRRRTSGQVPCSHASRRVYAISDGGSGIRVPSTNSQWGVVIFPTNGCVPRAALRAPTSYHMAVHAEPHVHTHDHAHDHGHSHAHAPMSASVLGWAMVATLGLVVAEVFGGFLGRSVALLNDAVHNLSDVPALGISWLAMRLAQRPADSDRTYGYHRAGTLAAFTNAILLILLSLWLGYEAIERLRTPQSVVESWMIWTSLAALAVNGGITLALVRGHADLNLRSILVHNFGDALSNIAIIVGAFIIRFTHAHWIDPILGLAIGLLVLYSSIGILRESAHILLEGRPREMKVEEVARAILSLEQVVEVHDVHIWSLGGGHNALSCHARIPDMHMDECEK